MKLDSDYTVRLATLGALGGDTTKSYDSVYEVDLAILERIQGGGIAQQVIDDNTTSTSTTYSSSKIVQLLADAGFKTAFVNELPATGDVHTIYFVPSTNPDTQNTKDEFMWAGSVWEQVGSTTVDLSNYYNKPEINEFLMQAANEIERTNTRIDNLIDDSSNNTNQTLSSSKILELVGTLSNTINNVYENAQTIDFKFSEEYTPAEIGDRVVYKLDDVNWAISEYKGEELGWEQLEWDASALYFDTENSVLYAYNTEAGELIEVTIPNTFVVSDLNADTKLKAVKTAGTYNVIQHLNSPLHGSYLKNWVMTVTSVDYDDEEYQTGDKWYQVLVNNVTIKKRSWSASRQTNDGWSNFSNYYKGEIKDSLTTPSVYYTYSQFKTRQLLDAKQDKLTAGQNIEIDENKVIKAKGYTYYPSTSSITVGDDSNVASGTASIAAGYGTKAGGYASFANGAYSEANSNYATSIGYNNKANGVSSIAVGEANTITAAAGDGIALGAGNNVSGAVSAALGSNNKVSGKNAVVINRSNIAAGEHSFVHGYCNIEDTVLQNPVNDAKSKYLEIVGNGGFSGSTKVPSNAYTLDWLGKGWFKNDVTCGGADGDNPTHRLSNKQNTLTAGTGISISGDTISCTVQPTPALEAGQNIEIANNKIAAKGYEYNQNLKSFTVNPTTVQNMTSFLPPSVLGLSDVQLSGAANTTTYTYSGADAAAFDSMVDMLISSGVGVSIDGTNYALITSADTTNHTITLNATLDASNAISNSVIQAFVQVLSVTISGAANTTTYTVSDNSGQDILAAVKAFLSKGLQISVDGYPVTNVTSIDTTGSTITLSQTLSSEAISDANVLAFIWKMNIASGPGSFAEGADATASGRGSHAEGRNTNASGDYSHTEGESTEASGVASHAEGGDTVASAEASHAEGVSTTAQNVSEHAEGSYNVSHTSTDNSGNTQHSIGIGVFNAKKNAVEVMKNGDMYVLGVGGYQGTDTNVQDPSIKTLQAYIASLEARINALEGNTIVE